MKRKEFINHIRWFTVLWLIPFHAACMYRPQAWGNFYIFAMKGGDLFYEYIRLGSMPWMMPMLFAVAGASACYALRNRSMGEFAKERVFRLLIPLFAAMLLFSPLQGYVGGLHHGKFTQTLSFLDYLKVFYTHTGSGYNGDFSFNSFWFIRYLLYMNVILFPLMAWFQKNGKRVEDYIAKIPIIGILALFIFPFEGYYVAPANASFREYLCFFVLGFLVLSNEEVHKTLRKWSIPLMALTVFLSVKNVQMCLYGTPDGVGFIIFYRFLRWLSVVAVFGFFKLCFDRRCKVTDYLSKSSYAFYILHEHTLLLVTQFIIKKPKFYYGYDLHELYLINIAMAFAATFLTYEILHRIPILRLSIGTKVKKKEKTAAVVEAKTE